MRERWRHDPLPLDTSRHTCLPAAHAHPLHGAPQWGRGMLEALEQRPVKPEDAPPGALFRQPYANGLLHLTHLVRWWGSRQQACMLRCHG